MIARDGIVSFYIFRLLKYVRIFVKKFRAWSYGIKNKILELAFYRGSIPDLIPEIYDFFLFMISEIFVFFFMTHLSSYNNICKTDLWYFWGNMKAFMGHQYTRWTSEGTNITRRLTKW